MELTNWGKKYILKHIRKKRKLSFKFRSRIWATLALIFSLLLVVIVLMDKSGCLIIVNTLLIISFLFCAIDNLSNIIKKYDDKFKWDIEDKK